MDKFLERYELSEWAQKEIENVNITRDRISNKTSHKEKPWYR